MFSEKKIYDRKTIKSLIENNADLVEKLLCDYERVVIFDTETSGLDPETDELIEFGAVIVRRDPFGKIIYETVEFLIDPNRDIEEGITAITGITNEMLRCGISKEEAENRIADILFSRRSLIFGYNIQFDLNFIYYMFERIGQGGLIEKCDYIDILSIFRDRTESRHKLYEAAEYYGVEYSALHRALDDALISFAVLLGEMKEKNDIIEYKNIIGFYEKYGEWGRQFDNIRYIVQTKELGTPLYEK